MLEALRRLAGADAIRAGDAAPAFRVGGVTPKVVVAPATVEVAAAVLGLCAREGWSVEPAGGGTWLESGVPPASLDVVLTAERLSAVEAYEPADLTISVGAGLPVEALRSTTAAHRQMLPLDPPARPGSTIGGLVSTASAGPLRLGFGAPRDHVLGLQIVTGDGRILDLGGRVVKNVAGYDLVRLLVGSRGTLGFITRAHLRLRPIGAANTTVISPAAGAADAVERAAAIMERITPAALEVVCPRSAAELLGSGRWHAVSRFTGNGDAVNESIRRVADAVDGEAEVLEARRASGFWLALGDAEAAAMIMIRFADYPSKLAGLMRVALRTLAEIEPGAAEDGAPAGPWRMAAHAGNGIVRLWRRAARALPPAHFGEAITVARAALAAQRGTILVPVAPAGSLDGVPAFGDPPARLVTERVRQSFDPAGVLASGRFLPGVP